MAVLIIIRRTNQRADIFAIDRPRNISFNEQIEDEDRHIVIHAQAEGRGVGHLQFLVKAFTRSDFRVLWRSLDGQGGGR